MRSIIKLKSLINKIDQTLKAKSINLSSGIQILCNNFKGEIGTEEIITYNKKSKIKSHNRLFDLLNKINDKTKYNDSTLFEAVTRLCDNYVEDNEILYSFGVLSDLHLQYETGQSDFERALNYFEQQSIPFTCVCGDLTWAGTMINADQYTSDWQGGLTDYKNIKQDRPVYAIGGNHECYTATYNTTTKTWSSVDTGLNVSSFKENTGCDPFYTISNNPTDLVKHNVYNPVISQNDIFIMLSIKKSTAPNLFFTTKDGEDQFLWLKNTLEENKNKRCYIFFHEHNNVDKTADPYYGYPQGISEETVQGKAFLDLLKQYNKNIIWFHGHTHLTLGEEHYPVSENCGYRSVHIPSLQGVRFSNEDSNSLAEYYYDTLGNKIWGSLSAEGYIVDVYKNKIVLKGINFAAGSDKNQVEPFKDEVYIIDTTI